jgi:chitodextrinase
VSRATLIAFAVLVAMFGLSGCGGGGAEENVPGSSVADAAAPSAPTGLAAAATSASQVNLSWNPATDNVGVIGYNVYRDGMQIATLGSVTTFQNTGLTPSTSYSYVVRARDAAGNMSSPSPSASATTQAPPDTTAPSTPMGLTATTMSSSQIDLSWMAATDDVGVTGYNIFRGGVQIATLGAVSTFQDTGLTAFTTYFYTVQARDAAGNVSPPTISVSATTQAVADTTVPSTPTGLSATAVSSSQINLSWTAATDNVGVAGYNVYRGGTLIATVGAVTSFQNTGLAASTTYSYTVRAFDAAGNLSSPSSSASATTQAPAGDTTAPSTPTGLTATAVSSSQISLSWTAATDNVGVTGYNVFRGGVQIANLGAVTTFQDNGLTASTTYSYTVRALDAAGNTSAQSSSASATTQAPAPDTTAPSIPTGLTANAVSSSQINLTWTASTDNVAVTGYRVRRDGVLLVTLGNVTTYQDTGLTAGTSYTYTVRALDAAGNVSALSSPASATTQSAPDTTAPTTPAGLTATAASSSQINLSWTAATDNVGVTGYNVYRGGTLIATLGTATSFQNTGLAASTTYSYTVRAFDAAGNLSSPSSSASATTQATPDTTAPSTPLGLAATAVSSAQINLSWTAAMDNVGVTGYNIYRGGMQIATLGAVTTFQSTGLSASTTYFYTVQAFDAAGNVSGQSIAANATTLASNTATLAWDASPSQNIAGYRIYHGITPGTYLQLRGQGVNAGNVTTYTVTGLNSGTRYYFVATAYDTAGNESAYSNEVFKDIP